VFNALREGHAMWKDAASNPNVSATDAFLTAVIPPFLPTDTQMDAFTLNTTARTVVMRHDLNAVLAANRMSPLIMPFTN
jgi:hypothetical protein